MRSRRAALLFINICLVWSLAAQDLFIVKGKIFDNETGRPIPAVNVFVRGEKGGTVSDTLGGFRLALSSAREAVVVFSHIAYRKTTRMVSFEKPQEVNYNIFLEPETIKLQELVIIGVRPVTNSEAAKRRALFSVGENELEHLGEPDMDRALQYFLRDQVKPLVDRMRKPEDDFTLYVNGEWKESLYLSDIDPFTVRRVMVWEMLGVRGDVDTRGRSAGDGRDVDVFPIGMPLRRGKYVVSVETKQ